MIGLCNHPVNDKAQQVKILLYYQSKNKPQSSRWTVFYYIYW